MGTLRLTLALAVFCQHSDNIAPWLPLGGLSAVNCFYVISGYLICRVLNERYGDAALTFYANRWLRLAPSYIAIAIIQIGFIVCLTGTWGTAIAYPSGVAASIASHVLIATQDWFHFLVYDLDGWFRFSANAGDPIYHQAGSRTVPGEYFMFVPQGWSLGVEAVFYLLAPWLLRRGALATFVAFAVALAGREIFLIAHSQTHNVTTAWEVHFAPIQMHLFFLGALSYFATSNIRFGTSHGLAAATSIAVFAIMVLAAKHRDTIRLMPFDVDGYNYFHPLLVAVMVPLLAHVTAGIRWDDFLGSLSYPVYITHLFSVAWPARVFAEDPRIRWWLALLITLALSVLLVLCIERPVDRLRKRIRRGVRMPATAGQPTIAAASLAG